METIVQDLAYGARILRKSPASTAVIILTLALGIGANTAIFSIVQAVLLRPLPYHDPSRLVLTFDAPIHDKASIIFVPYRHFLEWAAKNRSYETMAVATWVRGPHFMLGRGAPQSLLGVPVSVDFFKVLGVTPQQGRAFTRDDLTHGCTVVLSHRFWQSHLGGQANIIGQTLGLEDSSCTVIGIMPPNFGFYPPVADLWTLIGPGDEFDRNTDRNGVAVIGRLRPGISRAAAETDLTTLTRSIDHGRAFGVDVAPVSFDLQQELTWFAGRNLRLSLLVLFGAVCLVLLIACVNVANLLLGRLSARRRELAIRTALGSSRSRLIRQLLTESLLLCVSAAMLGIGIAAGAVHYFRVARPVELPPGATLGIDVPVLAFTMGLVALTTLLFGFMPAWNGSRASVSDALKSGSRSSTGPSGQRLARGLITAEIMLSLTLLAGAGMLIRSVANLAGESLGIKPDRLIAMTVSLPPDSYAKPEQRTAFYDQLRAGIRALPGVEGVGLSSSVALRGSTGISQVVVQGRPPVDPKSVILDTESQFVTDGYFRFMGIPLIRGREFEWADRGQTPAVAVVNAALVHKYFPNEDPLGKQIRFGGSSEKSPWLTIVGVTGNEKQANAFQEMGWRDPPVMYRALAQQPSTGADLVVRVASMETPGAARLQQEVSRIAHDVRVSNVYPMQHYVDTYLAYPKFRAVLMGAFAALALLLAVVGLYGVLSQLVAQRTQEIGIRMALGAQRHHVLYLILKQGTLLAAIGTALGLLAAFGLGRFLGSLLYGVRPEDPLMLGGVSALLILTALAASFIPARRATRVNPIDSLRSE